jgi:hypothetical protein
MFKKTKEKNKNWIARSQGGHACMTAEVRWWPAKQTGRFCLCPFLPLPLCACMPHINVKLGAN